MKSKKVLAIVLATSFLLQPLAASKSAIDTAYASEYPKYYDVPKYVNNNKSYLLNGDRHKVDAELKERIDKLEDFLKNPPKDLSDEDLKKIEAILLAEKDLYKERMDTLKGVGELIKAETRTFLKIKHITGEISDELFDNYVSFSDDSYSKNLNKFIYEHAEAMVKLGRYKDEGKITEEEYQDLVKSLPKIEKHDSFIKEKNNVISIINNLDESIKNKETVNPEDKDNSTIDVDPAVDDSENTPSKEGTGDDTGSNENPNKVEDPTGNDEDKKEESQKNNEDPATYPNPEDAQDDNNKEPKEDGSKNTDSEEKNEGEKDPAEDPNKAENPTGNDGEGGEEKPEESKTDDSKKDEKDSSITPNPEEGNKNPKEDGAKNTDSKEKNEGEKDPAEDPNKAENPTGNDREGEKEPTQNPEEKSDDDKDQIENPNKEGNDLVEKPENPKDDESNNGGEEQATPSNPEESSEGKDKPVGPTDGKNDDANKVDPTDNSNENKAPKKDDESVHTPVTNPANRTNETIHPSTVAIPSKLETPSTLTITTSSAQEPKNNNIIVKAGYSFVKAGTYKRTDLEASRLKIRTAAFKNKVKAEAARMLIDRTPKTVAGIKVDLLNLIKESESLQSQAQLALTEYDNILK